MIAHVLARKMTENQNPCRHVLAEPGIDLRTTYDVVILVCQITNQSLEVAAPPRCERFACACVMVH
jgi:hypothetical protein